MAEKEQIACTDLKECPLAEEAAEAAVKKVFAILGVDIDVPKDVETFRENLRFGASLRRYADRGMLAFVGGLGLLLLAAVGAGIVKMIMHG
jgi:hypothetical protein